MTGLCLDVWCFMLGTQLPCRGAEGGLCCQLQGAFKTLRLHGRDVSPDPPILGMSPVRFVCVRFESHYNTLSRDAMLNVLCDDAISVPAGGAEGINFVGNLVPGG